MGFSLDPFSVLIRSARPTPRLAKKTLSHAHPIRRHACRDIQWGVRGMKSGYIKTDQPRTLELNYLEPQHNKTYDLALAFAEV